MSNTQGTAIIRERGQLTIPDSIRKMVDWINPSSPVLISLTKSDEIVIRPHQSKIDWDELWRNIHRVRSFRGKGKTMSTSEFLEHDRKSH